MSTPISVETIKEHFPALQQEVNGRELIYLDSAATAQKPTEVITLLERLNAIDNGNVHRALHQLSAEATRYYEGARDKIKEFINGERREEVVFTSGATAALNLVAYSLTAKVVSRGDAIVISEGEHHSNIVPWQMAAKRVGAELRVIPLKEDGSWELEKLDQLLDEKVKIVSVAHISNVLGVVNPIEKVIAAAHKVGALVVIDGAQGVVHSKVDVQALGADFYLFSGHKLYAPTGTGVLWGRYELLENMEPWMGGGDMIESVSLKESSYTTPPLRFEAGTPNFSGFGAFGAAIDFLERIDYDEVEKVQEEIVQYIVDEFNKIPNLKLYGTASPKIALFSFNVEGVHPSDIAMFMDKMGIAVRSGQLCSEPVMDRFGVHSMVRASFAIYNTLSDAEKFIEGLKRTIDILS